MTLFWSSTLERFSRTFTGDVGLEFFYLSFRYIATDNDFVRCSGEPINAWRDVTGHGRTSVTSRSRVSVIEEHSDRELFDVGRPLRGEREEFHVIPFLAIDDR